MSVWQVLEIEPTDDKKTIKRAYAKKLKACRPELDPDGFQQLHEAYKAALDWHNQPLEYGEHFDHINDAQSDQSFNNTSSEPSPPAGPTGHSQEPQEAPIQPDPYADTSAIDHSAQHLQESLQETVSEAVVDTSPAEGVIYSELDRQIDLLINDEAQFFRIKLWRKLLQSDLGEEALADLSYKQDVSSWLFGWALYRQSQDTPLSRHLLRYFAEFFQWQNYQKRLDERFGYGITQQMLDYTYETAVLVAKEPAMSGGGFEQAKSARQAASLGADGYYYASIFSRLQSTVIDLVNAFLVAFVCLFFINFGSKPLLDISEEDRRAILALIAVVIMLGRYLWLVANNPSLGQQRYGLIMVDAHGDLPSRGQLCLRGLVLSLSLILLMVLIPINLICYFFTRQYIHDLASGIKVMDVGSDE